VSPLTVLALVLAVAVTVFCGGYWLGYRAHREQTRIRGERALEVLESYGDGGEGFLHTELPYVPTRRLLARATDLPDPHPINPQEGNR
jgi:hypothetical protein